MSAETHRPERGHDFYPPADVLAGIPPLYATEDIDTPDKGIHLHYFLGDLDWWVVEYDPVERLAFGYACLGDPDMAEWGYVSLVELEGLFEEFGGLGIGVILPPLLVERDLHWTPRTASEAHLPGRWC